MAIYAVIGTDLQTLVADSVQYEPQENEILMKNERPDGDYIASENGEWIVDTGKKIAELNAEFAREKANLCESYTAASMSGDTETADSIAQDMADLNEWYDAEYAKIEGGEE